MAKVKHNPKATVLIDNGITRLEPFAQVICKHLRKRILSSDSSITDDWK